jgi:hypothetical protein
VAVADEMKNPDPPEVEPLVSVTMTRSAAKVLTRVLLIEAKDADHDNLPWLLWTVGRILGATPVLDTGPEERTGYDDGLPF